ncbi:hypothetical protein FA95DRAFT_1604561 [Auriscalpium vulgare]|uniref:Uncharacterized protein n=1 Tax=Auriscalpium vulgare TaxID=40419 RepID=A0ACB8RZ46_9AGAM|nr:hypothetical protein FA95DRAFT_1604561 [Auriscalpium vulgare]
MPSSSIRNYAAGFSQRLATAPANLSSGPVRTPAPASAPQTNSSIAVYHNLGNGSPTTSRVVSGGTPSRRNSMSPTFIPAAATPVHTPRSRLPYPTGDYATPPDTVSISSGVFSPPNSPPSTLGNSSARPGSGAGLLLSSTSASSLPGLPSTASPSPSPSAALAAKRISPRPSSISPTPKKRYTVALGEPIMKHPAAKGIRGQLPACR